MNTRKTVQYREVGKQHYCKNAAPCSKDDLPVILFAETEGAGRERDTETKTHFFQCVPNRPSVYTLCSRCNTRGMHGSRRPARRGLISKIAVITFESSGCVYPHPKPTQTLIFACLRSMLKFWGANTTLISLGVLLVGQLMRV